MRHNMTIQTERRSAKQTMNIRKLLTFLLATNLITAIACDWQPATKALVIINALALLSLVARKAMCRRD